MTDKPRLGFIGIGLMGAATTLRLLDRGWRVTVWNREPDRLDLVVPHGAVAAGSPADVAAASDIVLMCVLDTGAVESCVFGPGGIASAARPPKLLIDMSTADPAATRTMAAWLSERTGTAWVDAPLSGGPPAAREGTMTVMAGGEAADIATAVPIMADLASNFTHIGSVGAGQTAKIINQAIVGTGYVLMAEALVLAEATGIASDQLPQCLAGGLADGNLLRRVYPQMQARAFDPPRGFARQLLKDMKAVIEFARAAGLSLPLVETAHERYASFVGAAKELKESAAIVELYEQQRAVRP